MEKHLNQRILLVDDDATLLEGLVRQHRKRFDLVTAVGPQAGLRAFAEGPAFAVVVADFQMPGMNGAAFLARVRELGPDTTRIMLTGQADYVTATEAVNRGKVFRFLSKPCEPEQFVLAAEAAIEQYRLVHSERMLLAHTLKGCIEVLSEVLALANPSAFGRAARARRYVGHIIAALDLPEPWRLEAAALLSQIGCVAIPDDVFERVSCGKSLSSAQLAMVDGHPRLARDLLAKVPRLEAVGEIVLHQRAEFGQGEELSEDVRLGSRILAAALDYEELISLGAPTHQAIAVLRKDELRYGSRVLDALASADPHHASRSIDILALSDVRTGMVLEEEIRNKDGILVLNRGHELTQSSLARLRNYADLGMIDQREFRVRAARSSARGGGAAA